MDEFIENMRLVLGALSYRLLEPVGDSSDSNELTTSERGGSQPGGNRASRLDTTFQFSPDDSEATGDLTDERLLIHEGSTASKSGTESLHDTYVEARKELLEQGRMKPTGEVYEFTEDVLCSSPTYASAVVSGANRSGPKEWKDENGNSLRKREEQVKRTLSDDGDEA